MFLGDDLPSHAKVRPQVWTVSVEQCRLSRFVAAARRQVAENALADSWARISSKPRHPGPAPISLFGGGG